MDDLAEFLAKCYDEAEALAKAAGGGEWSADSGDIYDGTNKRTREQVGEMWSVPDSPDDEYPPNYARAHHVADVDPKHRLADIALKRAILADIAHVIDVTNDLAAFRLAVRTMRRLGTEFAEHADYKAEGWAP